MTGMTDEFEMMGDGCQMMMGRARAGVDDSDDELPDDR